MKSIIKKAIIIAVITLLIAPIALIITFNMGKKIGASTEINQLMEGYADYYIYKYDYLQFKIFSDPCNGSLPYSRIWFLPFQKTKLLNRIKKDVNDILDDMLISNDIAAVDYQISDDFGQVFIYIDKNRTALNKPYNPKDPQAAASRTYSSFLKNEVGWRIELYDQLSHKRRTAFLSEDTITFIEIDPDTGQ